MAGLDDHALDFLSMMNQFYTRMEHWDIEIELDGRLFKCHRVMLAAASKYFDNLFKSETCEKTNPTQDILIILNVPDPTCFDEILRFIYTGDVRVDDSNALHLLSLSKDLRLRTDDVEKKCLQHLTSPFLETIPTANEIDLFCSARSKEESILVDILCAHIFGHLYYFFMEARLMEISFENLKALLVCAKRTIAPLPGSSDVLLAIILKWVNFNREERRQYRSKLMDSIDSSKVSSAFTLPFIKRLENAVDEARLSKDVQSIPELKALEMGIGTDDIGGDARLSATISLNVENISKLENGQIVYSPFCVISNLSFKLCVEREMDDVNVFVQYDGTDYTPEWSCYAKVFFTIKSLKEGKENFEGESDCEKVSSEMPEYNLDCRRNWNLHDLINPENGFIKDDGSITFDALMYVGVPCIE